MSELFDKPVNAQKEKNFWGSRKLLQAHEKVCDENERNKLEKRCTCKNVIYGRKPFIRCIQTTGENNLNNLQVNDS